MNNFYSPAEICENTIKTGVAKAKSPAVKLIALGLLAGIFIGLGGFIYTSITSVPNLTGFESLMMRFVGAGMFPAGLMLVVICGAELFTGNNLMTLAAAKKEITVGSMLRNWGIVWTSNLVGSILIAGLLVCTGLYQASGGAIAERAMAIAESKVAIPLFEMIMRAIFCNILVVLAVWMQSGAKDVAGKILAIWFPITLFVFAGFEHSVANMYYFPAGIFLGADVSWVDMFIKNVIPVTVGNLIGGAVFVPVAYYLAYAKKSA